MAEKRTKRAKNRFGISIRVKILIPVIIANIFIGVVLSTVIMGSFKSQCTETAASGALSINVSFNNYIFCNE